jgi:aryl-alcohol dehydrogenase-like predicted oxidoreductase
MADSTEHPVALGATDVKVSPLGVGTNSWGSRTGPDRDKRATFAALLDAGITFFDTAEIYQATASEKTIGGCLRAGGPAGAPVILTKFFPFPWRLTRSRLEAALRRSLSRLGRDRVDVYILHFPLGPISLETWVDALADAAEAGLTRAVGISNCNAGQVRRAHAVLKARGLPLACNEVELSLLRPGAVRNGLLDTCRELGVALIAYRPLAQGVLTGKYSEAHPPTGPRAAIYRREQLRRIRPLVEALHAVGARHGRTPGQVALNWVVCKGAIPIPGAKDPNQARDNAGAMGWRLSSDEIRELETIGQGG